MTASCVSRLTVPAGLLAGILAAVPPGGPGAAQSTGGPAADEPPVVLMPPGPSAPGDDPPPGRPRPGAAVPATGAEAPKGGGIRVDTLEALDPDSVGLLDAGAGGFGAAMWRGTPRALVARLLPRLPDASGSRTALDLARRLLLSAASAPADDGGRHRAEDSPSLVAMRVDRLLARGDVESTRALLAVVPGRLEDETILRARAEVGLVRNDISGACEAVSTGIGEYSDPFWRKAHIFCQLMSGKTQDATIGAALLREQSEADTPFFALVRALAGDPGTGVEGLQRPTALHVAMMRAARLQMPPALVTEASPAVLLNVVTNPNADLDTRLEAAERTEALGLLDTEALARVYLSVNFTPGETANALTTAERLTGPRGRALLMGAARQQSTAAGRAEIVSRALALARRDGRQGTAQRAFLPVIRDLDPTDDLAWFAVEAGAALYVAGAIPEAGRWYALARRKPGPFPAASGAGRAPDGEGTASDGGAATVSTVPADLALWPLAQLSGLRGMAEEGAGGPEAAGAGPAPSADLPAGDASGAGARPPAWGSGPGAVVTVAPLTLPKRQGAPSSAFAAAMFDRWWESRAAPGEEEVRRARAARLLSLVEALGGTVPDAAFSRVIGGGRRETVMPDGGVLAGLERAAAGGRIGETILLALIALGPEPPGRVDPAVLSSVVRALAEAGLPEDARRLALEAVFGAGL
jgi:hypothetical protein